MNNYLALTNFLLCSGIFWACLCRLNTEHSRRNRSIRARYTILLAGSLVMGMQPTLLRTYPGVADTIFSGVVTVFLILSMHRWRKPNDPNQSD